MKGIELAKRFYDEHGAPMLQKEFSNILPYLAVGLMGSGSECYGYDDRLSQDHDFEPAFCIFVPDEAVVSSRDVFLLERAYEKLPREYLGFSRNRVSAVGGNRHGVIKTADFFESKVGSRNGVLSVGQWFTTPEYLLCEATNGEIFEDRYGEVSKIRQNLCYYPQDIRLKKMAGNLLLMGQAGQYNYNRCILRKDCAAAQLAVFEFVKAAINVIFLLNKKYMPYYKWQFCALRELPILSTLANELEFLISSQNDNPKNKTEIIEKICALICLELSVQNLTESSSCEMEQQAYIINNKITDNNIRNLHILSGV